MMECPEALAHLEDLAVLNGPEFTLSADLQQHLASCDACHAKLLEMQEAWLLLPASLDKTPVAPMLEERIFSRIENEPLRRSSGDSGLFVAWKYVLAASVLIACVAGTMLGPRHWTPAASDVDRDIARVQELARQMDKLGQLEDTFANPSFRYVSLTKTGSTTNVQGYLVYDQVSNEGHFFGYDLVAPHGTFMLWLLHADESVAASAQIDVNSNDVGATIISVPRDGAAISDVVVTLEQDPNVATPTADVHMRSKFSR